MDISMPLLEATLKRVARAFPEHSIGGIHADFLKIDLGMFVDGSSSPCRLVFLGSGLAHDPRAMMGMFAEALRVNDVVHCSTDCHGQDDRTKILKSYECITPLIVKTISSRPEYRPEDWGVTSAIDEEPIFCHYFRLVALRDLTIGDRQFPQGHEQKVFLSYKPNEEQIGGMAKEVGLQTKKFGAQGTKMSKLDFVLCHCPKANDAEHFIFSLRG